MVNCSILEFDVSEYGKFLQLLNDLHKQFSAFKKVGVGSG